jgi:hypothetical protein
MSGSSRSPQGFPESVVFRWMAKAFLTGLFLGTAAAIVALLNR